MKNTNMFNYDQEEAPYEDNSSKYNIKTLIKYLALILVLGASVFWAMNFLKNTSSNTLPIASQKHFYDLGEIIVNLSNSSLKNYFLKVDLSINLTNQNDEKIITNSLPIIKDSFQIFLRELRVEDISGSGGAFYIKTELLKRLNTILYPTKVEDIFIKEIIVN
jgi:flagellar basal body-associated protein FliL